MHNIPCWAQLLFLDGAWCAPLSQRLLPLNGAGGHQSLLSNLLSPQLPLSSAPPLPPLFVQLLYPNKLATQVGEGRRRRRRRVEGVGEGGPGLVAEESAFTRWGARCLEAALSQRAHTHRHTYTHAYTHTEAHSLSHTHTVSEWLDAEREKERRESFQIRREGTEESTAAPQTAPFSSSVELFFSLSSWSKRAHLTRGRRRRKKTYKQTKQKKQPQKPQSLHWRSDAVRDQNICGIWRKCHFFCVCVDIM